MHPCIIESIKYIMERQSETSLHAEILRDKYSKAASLKIETKGAWKLFVGNSVDNINKSKPILEGTGSGLFPLNVSASFRNYFEVTTSRKSRIIAERHLPMAGGYNFRDLGGIKTKDGRYIKWGKLFRADELSGLTNDDVLYLSSIPITSIIDFRAVTEMKRAPDKLPTSVKFSYPLSITPGNLSTEGIQANLLKTNIDIHMKQMNRILVSDPVCVNAFRKFFNIVQKRLSAPLIFHCSAGKDRTGMAAALLLFALGVSEEKIMDDYLMSKVFLADKYDVIIAKYPRAESIFTVKKMFLKAGINQIKRDYGTIDYFLENVLGVNIDKLQEMYLTESVHKEKKTNSSFG